MQARIASKVAELYSYPNVVGVKALKGPLKGQYRVRVGNYRIAFTIEGSTITITAVDDRKDSY
jgi:mRNA-degrading endonuclease RelE of RelBE toxin-antitoxin system